MEFDLGQMSRQVDSSLLDEWEKMRDPDFVARPAGREVRPPGAEEAQKDITRDTKAFTGAIRTRIFSFLRGLVIADFEAALSHLDSPNDPDGKPWTTDRLAGILEEYHQEHQFLCLDPNARNLRHTYVTPSEDKRAWGVQQMLVDPDAYNDWVAEFEVDLPKSRAADQPVLFLRRIGRL